MEERVLNRATGIIDRNDFLVLIQMHMKHEWLVNNLLKSWLILSVKVLH